MTYGPLHELKVKRLIGSRTPYETHDDFMNNFIIQHSTKEDEKKKGNRKIQGD
jgi:hypothetical protein